MSDALTLLKAGIESQPLFLAHGMGGSTIEFSDLVKFVRTERSVYGLQARGNDGAEQPFERIEDLARYYLEAIKQLQYRGPYFLIGFSLGGLVALEMAQQLSSTGEIVALLAMMDSYPHPKQLSLWQRTRLASRLIKRRTFTTTLFSTGSAPHLKSSVHDPDDQAAGQTDETTNTRLRAYDSAHLAWRHYQPRFYHGKIHFVRVAVPTIYPDNPIAVWGKLASELEVQTVPGDHHEILTANYEILGSVLSGYLAER
jgi:thioesterase domain-containing protein